MRGFQECCKLIGRSVVVWCKLEHALYSLDRQLAEVGEHSLDELAQTKQSEQCERQWKQIAEMPPTFQYTFICSACCCWTVSTAGTSSMTAARTVSLQTAGRQSLCIPGRGAVFEPDGADSSAISSNRYTATSSSLSTPRSTQVVTAFSAAALSIRIAVARSAMSQVSGKAPRQSLTC